MTKIDRLVKSYCEPSWGSIDEQTVTDNRIVVVRVRRKSVVVQVAVNSSTIESLGTARVSLEVGTSTCGLSRFLHTFYRVLPE